MEPSSSAGKLQHLQPSGVQGINAGCDSTTPLGQSCGYATIGGKPFNQGRGDVTGAWPARIMQFGMKFSF